MKWVLLAWYFVAMTLEFFRPFKIMEQETK
jgi:hypothetical protein